MGSGSEVCRKLQTGITGKWRCRPKGRCLRCFCICLWGKIQLFRIMKCRFERLWVCPFLRWTAKIALWGGRTAKPLSCQWRRRASAIHSNICIFFLYNSSWLAHNKNIKYMYNKRYGFRYRKGLFMIATKQVDIRANIKKYFDIAFNGEPVIVSDRKSVV